ALYHDALAEARDDALQATIHTRLATLMRWAGGVERAVEHAESAVRAASRITDPAVRCRALAILGVTRFSAGHGIAATTTEEAMALERSSTEWPLDEGPTVQFGFQLLWSAQIERGREVARELLRAATARNDPALEAEAAWFMGFLAWRAGDWEEAENYIAE